MPAPTFRLQRDYECADGILGTLRIGATVLRTMERDHADPQYKPIAAGVYRCQRRRFNTGGYMTYEVTGVPGRSLLLLHKGNTEDDSRGCILLGMDAGTYKGKLAVLESARAFYRFALALQGVGDWWIDIRDVDPALPEPDVRIIQPEEWEPEATKPLPPAA